MDEAAELASYGTSAEEMTAAGRMCTVVTILDLSWLRGEIRGRAR